MGGWLFVAGLWAPAPSDPSVVLEWDAPASCPSAARVGEELRSYVGRPAGTAGGERRRASASVRELTGDNGESTWVLDLRVELDEGELTRRLEGESCEVLASATALMVSVLLHPAEVLDRVEVQNDPAEDPHDESSDESRDESRDESSESGTPGPPVAPADSSETRTRALLAPSSAWWLGVDGGVEAGIRPGASPRVGGKAIFERASLRVELDGAYGFATRAAIPSADAPAGVQIAAWGVSLHACYQLQPSRRVTLPLCAGAEGGELRARGYGLESAGSARAAWGGLLLGPRVRIGLHPRVALALGVDTVFGLHRPAFSVSDVGTVHRAGVVGVRGSLGFEFRISPASGARSPASVANEEVVRR